MIYKSLVGLILTAVIGGSPVIAQEDTVTDYPIIGTWMSECDAWGTAAVCTSIWRIR